MGKILPIIYFPIRLAASIFIGLLSLFSALLGLLLGLGVLALLFLSVVIFLGFFGGLIVLLCQA